jgi:hypothetical protein
MNDEAADRKARRDARVRERQDREVMLAIMNTLAGRRWVYNKLASLKAFHTPYTGEINSTLFNCGMQNAGFAFLGEILGAAPAEYLMMLRENSNASGPSSDDADDSDDASWRGDNDTGDASHPEPN